MNRPARLAALAVAALAASVAALAVGGAPLGLATLVGALFHPHAAGDATTIVWAIRLPRVLVALVVGASLAVAGFLLQAMLRNPLVDPFLTGVSAGAGAAIAIGVAFGISAAVLPGIGFAAALATALLVAALARRGTGLDAERLILAGVSLSALFSAIVALALTRLGPAASATIVAWLAGSLAGRGWTDLAWTSIYALAGAAIALATVPAMAVLRLGDGIARAAGVDVGRLQWAMLVAATLLTSAAVTLAGILGFVGLIVPHLARRLVGTDPRAALPASALLGMTIVPLADAAARSLMPPVEIPLGVLLAFVGVPAFLYLYLQPGRTRLWGT